MLRRACQFSKLTVTAGDGPIGTIDDLLFDDLEWSIRYLVVETDERRVLLVPSAVKAIEWGEQELRLDLSREQVANSPPLSAEEPLSRQYQEELHAYYDWPFYWTTWDPLGVGGSHVAQPLPPALPAEVTGSEEQEETNTHLRSLAEVTGYEVRASNGSAGHVSDLIVNSENWAIFYLLIDTSSWLRAGRQVLLAPTWVEEIEWSLQRLTVDLSQELIEKSPEFDPEQLIEREYEERLYEHYGRRGYWQEDLPKDIS